MAITKQLEGQPALLVISNHQCEDCGLPPEASADGKYVSYFENVYGEQWIFVGDREAKTATLYGGDVGWKNGVQISLERPVSGWVLNTGETTWLINCLATMTLTPFYDLVRVYNREALRRTRAVDRVLNRRKKKAAEAGDEDEEDKLVDGEVSAEVELMRATLSDEQLDKEINRAVRYSGSPTSNG